MAATVMIVRYSGGHVINVASDTPLQSGQFGKKGSLIVSSSSSTAIIEYHTKDGLVRWQQVLAEGDEFMLTPSGAEQLNQTKPVASPPDPSKEERDKLVTLGKQVYHEKPMETEQLPEGTSYSAPFPAARARIWTTDGEIVTEPIDDTTVKLTVKDATWAACGTEKAIVWGGIMAKGREDLFHAIGMAEEVLQRVRRVFMF